MKTISKLLIGLLGCALVLPGCKQKPVATEVEEEVEQKIEMPAVLSLKNVNNLKGEDMLSGIGTDIKYIPLETTNKCLLKTVARIALLKNGNIVVTDNQSLYLFNPDGKFIRPVSQRGSGPADYTRISALAADPLSDGFFLQSNKKVIAFDGDGNFLRQFPTEDRPMDMVVDLDGNILLHRMNVLKSPEDTTTTWLVYRYNQAGEELQRVPDPAPRMSGEGVMPMVMPLRPFYLHNGEVRISEIGNDTIYTVGENKVYPYTVIDLGNMGMNTTPEGTNVDVVFEDLNKKLMLAFLCEDDFHLYMVFGWGFSGDYIYSTYNKTTGTVVNYGNGKMHDTAVGLINDIDGGLPFYPFVVTPDGTRIMWKSASDFKEAVLEKEYEERKSKYGQSIEKLWEVANSVDDDDNPVLILVP